MPIDVDKVVGAELTPTPTQWGPNDIILYHLGLGAGTPSTDPNELEYTYEANLKVLPTWGVVPPFPAMGGMAGLDGLDINWALVLHGEQELEIHGPIPTSASVVNQGRIEAVYDKGKAALIILTVETVSDEGTKLFTNRFSIFARGEGGFGGPSAPQVIIETPDRAPDHVVESPTLDQQALLYRLSGDFNPLHADPAFAAFGGFDKPILHGLCTYGVVAKAVVDAVCGGDVERVANYRTRFAGVVFPGETIVTSMWLEDDGVILDVTTKERGEPVLKNARIELR